MIYHGDVVNFEFGRCVNEKSFIKLRFHWIYIVFYFIVRSFRKLLKCFIGFWAFNAQVLVLRRGTIRIVRITILGSNLRRQAATPDMLRW